MVADFLAVYGLRLWDVLDWPARILLSLVEELPDDGAFAASVQGGPEFRGWGVDRHMFANLWDLTAQVATDPKKRPPRHPRPVKKQENRGLFGLKRAIPREGM